MAQGLSRDSAGTKKGLETIILACFHPLTRFPKILEGLMQGGVTRYTYMLWTWLVSRNG